MSESLIEVIRCSEQQNELWQWDTGRQIIITPEKNAIVDEVHFSNAYSKDALVVKPQVNEQGNIVADIPNILLWQVFPINVYVVMEFPNGKGTIYEEQLKINPRKKPSDYVYTETEILNYLDLEKRIKVLEESGTGGGIAKETDPTVPQWAKEPTKPSYTAEEVGAPTKEEFDKLSEDIADLKENGTGTGGSGLTKEMATALDNMFKVCAYTKEDVSEEYNAFRNAFGLDVVLIPATAIALTSSVLSFTALNASRTLKATLEPTDSTDKVTWTSSNEAVAKVVNGVVTVVGEGTATITATATSGVKATCSVNVVIASNVYTITNTLENVTNSNSATTVEEGSNYIAYLTVAEGYELTAPKITMGGIDITATAYANGTISINSVTGNIVIEAIATEINTLIYELAQPLVCDGTNYVDTGVVVCGTGNLYSKDFTIAMEVEIDGPATFALKGGNGVTDNAIIFTNEVSNSNLFKLTHYETYRLMFYNCAKNSSVGIDIGGYYGTHKNYTAKIIITHEAGSESVNKHSHNTSNEYNVELVARTYDNLSNGNHNKPLLLNSYYDESGNIVPSNFRGTIKQFAIHNEIWSEEVIKEYLGVE